MFSQNKTRFSKGFSNLTKGVCLHKVKIGFENKSFGIRDNTL
jgi:hypothetical protein